MFRQLLSGTLLAILAACGSSSVDPSASENGTEIRGENASDLTWSQLSSTVAWNERVEINSNQIPNPTTQAVKVVINNITYNPVFHQTGRVVLDLPATPAAPGFPTSAPHTLTLGQYNVAPTQTQSTQYSNRGVVNVKVVRANNPDSIYVQQNYTPYGSVKTGEITVIGEGTGCVGLPGQISGELLSLAIGGNQVCYNTLSVSNRGTKERIAALAQSYPSLKFDRNTLSSLDQGGANSFDPSCEQIEKWLNPVSGNLFDTITVSELQGYTNTAPSTRGAINGAGVTVHVVGGGIGANDLITCDPSINFNQHDTHIVSTIQVMAPSVTFAERKVCDNNGNCPASAIAKGLLQIAQAEAADNTKDAIINMSLGGPLPNRAMYEALNYMAQDVLVMVSGGNHPLASTHYPASYASGVAPINGQPFSQLNNVLSVGAAGISPQSSWHVAGFNTRANGNVLSPAVNLCPASVLSFRCDFNNLLTLPFDHQGASGSSFAAPGGAAVGALFLQRGGFSLTPAQLKLCITNKSLLNSSFGQMVWYDPAGC